MRSCARPGVLNALCNIEDDAGLLAAHADIALEALLAAHKQHPLHADVIARVLVDGQVEDDRKLRTLTRRALDLDAAAHELDNVLGDGHAQTRTLDFVRTRGFRAGERVKDVLEELLIHADARVGHLEKQARMVGIAAVKLRDAELDLTAVRRVLDRVGK